MLDCITDMNNVIYLCSCAANKALPDRNRIEAVDLDSLYKAAQKHMLASMVGMTLKSVGISTPQFSQAIALAQRKAVVLNNDLSNVIVALEAAGIWYMPLKGAVLKEYYPSFAMREMADYDVLIDANHATDVKAIMEGLGFQVKTFGIGNDDSYIKPPVTNFEMHTALFGDKHDDNLRNYYKNVKDRLLKDEGNNYGYHFSPEDFYIFMVAHEYKHYSTGGTGLRSLLDTYVYLQKNDIDMAYVAAEVEKLGIANYERLNRSLALKLFSKGSTADLTEEEQHMLDYIVSSGTYGTIDHKVENKLKKTGEGKLAYFARRVFGPFRNDKDRAQFERRYATFFKYPVLLPFLPFYRLFRALKKGPKRIKAEANALRKAGKANELR